ncbi:hypothetical protein, partial [Paenibacillus ihuae]|uniref:hypothetical protein n=1 Tax=Paenibacillus ihuae TaxID=1232431 RepID=UPI00131D460A
MDHTVRYQPRDGYLAWLQYRRPAEGETERYKDYNWIVAAGLDHAVLRTAADELAQGLKGI